MTTKFKQMIAGAGGGGKGGAGSGGVSEEKDSLRSKELARFLDAVGEGPMVGLVDGLKSVYIDQTPVLTMGGAANFNNIKVAWTTGEQNQDVIPGEAGIESSTDVSTLAECGKPVTRVINEPNANSIRVTVGVDGLTTTDSTSGEIKGSTVSLLITVAGADSTSTTLNDTISGKTSSSYRRSYEIPVKGDGPWTISVERLTPDSTSSLVADKLYFVNFTTVIDAKLSYPMTALVGVSIDSANFNSVPERAYDVKGLIVRVPSNYDPEKHTYTGSWDGTWKLAWTDDPAWCFDDLLTNDRYGLGEFVEQAMIDKWTLYQISKYCNEMVPNGFGGTEPRFTCNLCLQTREEAYKVIQNFASIFRAITFWSAGNIYTVQDRPMDPVAIFTNANVINGEFVYSGSSIKQRHTVALVTWNNPDMFYRQDVEYVQDDESIREYGVIQTDVVAFGCTSRGQAHRLGKWALATEKYATEMVTFKTGLAGCSVYPGAIIKIANRLRAGKRMGGRIVSYDKNTVILDAPVTLELGGAYTIMLVDETNTPHSVVVSSQTGGTYTTLEVVEDLSTINPAPESVFLLTSSLLEAESFRVIGMKEEDDKTISISALAHNADLFAYVDEDAKFQEPITSNIKTRPDVPTDLKAVVSNYVVANRIVGLKLLLSWFSTAPQFRVTWVETTSGLTTSKDTYEPSIEIDNVTGGTYVFSVVALSSIGIASPTAQLTYVVGGTTSKPLPLTTFSARGDMFQNVINWTWPNSIDLDLIEIWASATGLLEDATKLADLSYPTNNWLHIGLAMGVTIYYWGRTRNTAKEYSDWAGPSSATTVSDPDLINSVLSGQVTSSSLFKALRTKIDSLDGDPTDPGSLAFKIESLKVVNDTNVAAIHYGDQAVVTNTGAVVESINTLQSTVGEHTAKIQTQSRVTDGLTAEYFVKVDNNGYVSGFGQSSGVVNGAFTSDFTVLADSFAVVKPGDPKVVPFVIGSVNGVIAVGLNGATIVDGTISAKAINTTGLIIQAREEGARMMFTPDVLKVYDDAGIVRVKIGNLLL